MFDGALLIPENSKNNKNYNLILYQVTKNKTNNRVSNESFSTYKEMVIKNIEILFNIKIKKCNFIYILFFEDKDKSLMEYCNKIENKLDYIFYSIEKNDFVNEYGNKIRIKNYVKDMKNIKQYLDFFPKNENRD